jgi:hypothetical protein
LVLTVKLFLSVATVCLAVGYAARHRANGLHRRVMALAVALVCLAALVLLVGRVGLGLPLRPAFWLGELLGSGRAALYAAATHQGLGVLALLGLIAQALLGWRRHPLHRPLAAAVLPLWLLVWIAAMFGYV